MSLDGEDSGREVTAPEIDGDLAAIMSNWDDAGPSPTFTAPSFDDEASSEDAPKAGRRDGASISSIEDFYARYPEMGRGEWKLRVTRTEPKAHRGQAIGGFICDIFERLSQSEFGDRFGGGTYTVSLMRPTSMNEGTLADYKTVREIKLRLAGEPKLRGETPMQYEGSNNKIEVARLQLEERERNRLHEEKKRAEEKAERLQRELMPNFYATTKRVVDDLSGMKEAQVEFWKGEVERLRGENETLRKAAQKEIDERDQALKRAHEENLSLKQQARDTDRNIESKLVEQVKNNYESRINDIRDSLTTQLNEARARASEERTRLNEEHSKKLQELTSTISIQASDAQRRWDSERSQLFASMQQDRERSNKEAEDRVKQVERTYENRIADLRLATDRELQSLRDATAREIESIRQSERAQASIAKETAELRKEAIKAEEQRLRQELSDLRRENSDLRDRLDQERASKHKDLPTAIREAREMASHLGLVEASEIERPEPEQSTMSQFVGLARQAFDSAPQILDKIMQARKEQQDAVLQAQAMQTQAAQIQAQQQAMAMQQRQVRQLPAPQPQAQPQRQQQVAPRPQPRYAPPAMTMQPQSTSVPFGAAPAAPPKAPVPFAPPPVTVGSPVQPIEAATPMREETSDSSIEQAPLGLMMPAMPDPEPGSAAGEITEAEGNLIVMFFQKLEVAIENKVVSPETFAIGVIDEIGAQQTASLLAQFSPQDIIETAQQLSPDTRIATRDGQKFVHRLWQVGGEKVAAAGFALPA